MLCYILKILKDLVIVLARRFLELLKNSTSSFYIHRLTNLAFYCQLSIYRLLRKGKVTRVYIIIK